MSGVTLQTIADQVGVSRMTVSNAFARPDQLSQDLRERILEVARDLGYAGPNPTARALARGTTGAVGVLLTDSLQYAFSDPVATRFLGALVEGLAPTGLALTLLTTSGRHDVVPARDVAIDAALVYSCQPDSDDRHWLLQRKLPVVFVDQDPVARIPSINIDDRGGARAASEHLVELGHRNIAILTRTTDGTTGEPDGNLAGGSSHPQVQRLLGWREGLEAVDAEPVVAFAEHNTQDAAHEPVRQLLSRRDRPTAVLCFSDVVARGVVDVARELGLGVPGDLSVVGFDDGDHARLGPPALTTVRQDVEAKGHLAADALVAALAVPPGTPAGRARRVLLPTELVVRESTAPPPKRARRSSRSAARTNGS